MIELGWSNSEKLFLIKIPRSYKLKLQHKTFITADILLFKIFVLSKYKCKYVSYLIFIFFLMLKYQEAKVCLIKNVSRQTSLAKHRASNIASNITNMSVHVWLVQRAVCCLLLEVRRASTPITICRGMRKVLKKTIFAHKNN